MPPLEDSDGDELTLSVEESLVIRWTLQVYINEDETNQQRENIFYTRCYVQNKGCSLIIDSGSCINICSTTLVSKLIYVLLSMLNHINCNGWVIVGKWRLLSRLWFYFLLGSMLMRFYVTWYQCKQVISY
jgi:hypothetical protein